METMTAAADDERCTAIIETLDVAAIVLDQAETVTHLNQPAATVLGVYRDQILGHAFHEVLDDRYPGCTRVRAALEKARGFCPSDQAVEGTVELRGHPGIVRLKLLPLRRSDGRQLGTLIILRDVTEPRRKGRASKNLAAAAAHELYTPLTSISLAIGLLQRNIDSQHELISGILQDVERVRHVSASFVDMVRRQPIPMAVRGTEFDLATIVAFIARKFEPLAARKNVNLSVRADNDLQVYGDPLKLSWVLATLVSNALRFVPEKGTVELLAEREREQVRVSVRDNGPGISPAISDVVFGGLGLQPGRVFDVGTGLGLAIAKEIVQAHGGQLSARTPSDSGSILTFALPLSTVK